MITRGRKPLWARALLLLLGLFFLSLPAAPISEIVLTIGDIVSPAASLKRISAKLAPGGAAEIVIGELNFSGRSYNNSIIVCASLVFSGNVIRCPRGKLVTKALSADLAFTYVPAAKRLDLDLSPSSGEHWRITGNLGNEQWQAELFVTGGQLARLAPLISEGQPRPTKGQLAGRLKVTGAGRDISHITGDLRVSDLAFSDTAGLHASEKLGGSLAITGDRAGTLLRWQAALAWDEGEVFWAPLYFPSGGHVLKVRGTLAGDKLRIEEGNIRLAKVGEGGFSLEWDLRNGLDALTVNAADLDGSGLYTLLFKPFLEKTAFDQLTVGGTLNAGLTYANKQIQRFDLAFIDTTLIDVNGRFALEKLNAKIPWRVDAETKANIRFDAAKLLGIPLGAVAIPVTMRGFDFQVDEVAIPVLDGKLLAKDLRASQQGGNWQWQFSGVLLPVSMEATTQALGGPVMRGILSATIPQVTYQNGTVNVGGGIGIRVFDGDVAITDLKLAEPLGRAPRLNATVEMRNLDLGLVTSTFKFGSMDGRIDADVKGLELSNWKPVRFDARVASSPGSYRKRISQQAVQNISALGGAGAVAAIQRSVLRFFEEFGYEKIALSCRLRNNVCEMSGVEGAPQGYVIVKGGGIPAITVTGYNRYVGWNELLERLSRITQGNAQPVIK